MDTPSKILFGQRLRALRLQSGTPSAKAFAEAVGISRATLYLWEDLPDPPSPKYWKKLCEVLEISPQHLLLGTDHASDFSGIVAEDAHKSGPAHLELIVRGKFQEALEWAAGDTARLGWLVGQMHLLLSTASQWLPSGRKPNNDPDENPLVQEAVRAAHQNAFRSAAASEGKRSDLRKPGSARS